MHEPQQWSLANAATHLRTPTPDDDKYRRGVLGLRTGSSDYPGAAVLGAEAAWRTGIGLVRYIAPLDDPAPAHGLPSPAAAVLAARPETVFTDDSAASRARCDAWLVGSGTDPAARSFAETEALRALFATGTPLVVDAGALELLTAARKNEPQHPSFAPGAAPSTPAESSSAASLDPARTRLALAGSRLPEVSTPTIVTPHRGEFQRMWRAAGLEEPLDLRTTERAAATLARRIGATVLLKGSVSVCATPGGFLARSGPATPWLATAGTGDVLAGILGALVAAHAEAVRADPELLGPLGSTAATLHDAAARTASGDPRGPITALDVAHALPRTIATLLT